MPDPIKDLQAGLSDEKLKQKYKLSDDDVFTLRKYNYATTKGGASIDDALELYPSVSKFIGTSKPAAPAVETFDPKNLKVGSDQALMPNGKPQPDITPALKKQLQDNTPALVLGENIANQPVKDLVQKRTGVPVNMQRTPEQVQPEQVKPTKEQLANQKEADAFYEKPLGKLYFNVVQPIWKAAGESGANMAAGLTRAAGQVSGPGKFLDTKDKLDAMANGLVNFGDFSGRGDQNRPDGYLYRTPTKLQGNLINDGRVSGTKLIPRTLEALTNMAVLLSGGVAAGGGKGALLASSYFNTVERYRKEAQAAGLTGGRLSGVSGTLALVSSALELVSPNNPVIDKFGSTVLKTAIKNIKEGVSAQKAIASATKTFISENSKEVGQELLQGFGDHVIKALSDETVGSQFDENLNYENVKNEVLETALMTILPTTLLMAPNTIRHHKPSTQELSSLNMAAENQDQFNQTIDKSVASGQFTQAEAETMKDNIGLYTTKVKQMRDMGYSPDQSARIAFAAYKDAKTKNGSQAITDSPVLKATIGAEAKKDEEVLQNEVKDAALGIPEVGTELTGEDLSVIVNNTPNSPSTLPSDIAGKDYLVDEIDLQEKYDNDPAFKLQVEQAKESKEDPEGLRTPAIINQSGEVLDGNKRLAQQFANGDKTARVFRELKSESNTKPAVIMPENNRPVDAVTVESSETPVPFDNEMSKTYSNAKSQPVQQQQSQPATTEQFANYAPDKRPGGIQVAPIPGGQPKDLSKIILDLGTGLKQNIFFSKLRKGAAGTYAPGSSAVKIRFSGDLDTTAHEIGHSLDDKYKVIPEVMNDGAAMAEVPQFSKFGSTPPPGHPDPQQYATNEGFAEFLRALIVNPAATRQAAPNLYRIYEAQVPSDAQGVIANFSTDVRTWAGASGADITKANIQFDAEKAPPLLKRLFGNEKNPRDFNVNTWDWLSSQFVNPLRVFEKSFDYLKQIKGITNVNPEDNPILLARLLNGIDGKFGQVLKNGMIDFENNVLKTADGKAKNLNWLLEPLDNTDQASVERDMKDVISYMVSERTVELGARYKRESILSGVGGGIYTDIEIAKKALDEYENGDQNRLARIKEAAARYREFADDTLKYMVDKGRLSEKQYAKIKEDNTQYVAMQRVLETEPGEEVSVYKAAGGKLTSVADPIKKAKGSTKKIINPYVPLLDTLHKSLREADRNEAMRAFRDMLTGTRGMNDGDVVRLADIGVIAKEGDKETTTIFVDGVAEKWKFQKDIYENLKGLDNDKAALPWYFTIVGKILRETTTKFPVFAVRNVFRDTQDRLIKSNEGSGLRDLMGNPEDWNTVERIGGLNAGFYARNKDAYYGLMKTAINEVAKRKNTVVFDANRLKNVWDGYENLLFKSETSNRVAEYRAAFRKAKKQGMDDYNASLYAAFQSRDLMDFAVAGHTMRVINQIIPFTNAAVQALRSTAVRVKANPVGFLARSAIYNIIPRALLWLWIHSDDDEAKEYEDLPTYQRDMFWNKKVGPNLWIAAPMPYELSVMGAGVDRLMSSIYGNEKAFDGYAGTVAKSFIPLDEATLAGPFRAVIENITNYDFFREKSLIPPNEDVLNLALRNTQTASRLGQVIQSAAGIDARKADHLITSTFSYVGKTAMKVSDLGREESRNQFNFTDFGFFKNSPGYSSAPVQEAMEFAKEWGLTQTSPYKTFNSLTKTYFMAKTDEEIEKAGDALIDYSKEMLNKWEESGIAKKKVDAKQKDREEE